MALENLILLSYKNPMDQRKFDQAARELEKAIDRLNVLYEKYFMGLDRLEPAAMRAEIKRRLLQLKEAAGRNTGFKFRVTRLEDKFKTYETYWNRVLREIENGTYHREIKRLKRRLVQEGIPEEMIGRARTRAELEAALAHFQELMDKADASPQPAQQRRPLSRKDGGDGDSPISVPDPLVDKAYRAFLQARKRTGEPTDGITRDAFAKVLEGQVSRAKKEKGWSKVGIKITIQQGRAVLKLVNKEEEG